MGLTEYKRKRDFKKTREPAGKVVEAGPSHRLKFVVQKHAATRLHYDVRLELDGVLKSWAVPKGPSLDPAHKQLAVEVEDHPLQYAKFEGTIPEGEYGAGEVIVWDRGTWKPLGDPHAGLKKGHLSFELAGEKLQGSWSLLRMKGGSGNKNNWLLVKRRDGLEQPNIDITAERPESVKTQRLLEDLQQPPQKATSKLKKVSAKRKGPAKQKAPATKAAAVRTKKKSPAKKQAATPTATRSARRRRRPAQVADLNVDELVGARRSPLPRNLSPQLATLVSEPPVGENWLHEVKFDGYRILAYCEAGRVKLITRNEQDWTHRYGVIAEKLAALPLESAVIDGELVALLSSGVSNFAALQQANNGEGTSQLSFYAFDLLYLNGFDLRNCALLERKRLLSSLLPEGDEHLHFSDHFTLPGEEFLKHCCRLGLEGMISKRADRPYLAGRGNDWVKSKCLATEELVIGGFTISEKVPRGFGALLTGYFDGDEFVYAGRVGTGFNSKLLVELRQRLDALQQKQSPYSRIPAREVDRTVRWVQPRLVAQIQFTNWTEVGVMRHPSFQGLREDKPAKEVTRPASLSLAQPEEAETMKARPAKKQPRAKTTARSSRPKVKRQASPPAELPASISVKLTHPEREVFPEAGVTKLALATYYAQVAPWILPHVQQRPLSLVRCPEGQTGGCFFQKHSGMGTPRELGRIMIQEKKDEGEYLFIRDLNGLVALAQISVLEIHLWGSRCDRVELPDRLIFDLDPDPGVAWPKIVAGAETIREMLLERGLQSFVKTTGGKGVHVVAPVSPRRHAWEAVKAWCKGLAEELAAREPAAYTSNMSKAARRGKIFVDYLRNDFGSTAIAPYSTRAKPSATVAMPIEWEELADVHSDQFTIANALEQVQSRRRDPWEEMDSLKQSLRL